MFACEGQVREALYRTWPMVSAPRGPPGPAQLPRAIACAGNASHLLHCLYILFSKFLATVMAICCTSVLALSG